MYVRAGQSEVVQEVLADLKIPFLIKGARTMGSVWIAIHMTQSVNVKNIAINFKEPPK